MSIEELLEQNAALAKGVYEILILCKDIELPGKVPDLNDDRVIAAYVAALVCNGIDVSMLKKATGALMSDLEFFPRPSALKNACIPYRERAMEERRQIVWANPKLVEDELGNLTAVIGESGPERPRLVQSSMVPIGNLISALSVRKMPLPARSENREYGPIEVDPDEESAKRSQIEKLRDGR